MDFKQLLAERDFNQLASKARDILALAQATLSFCVTFLDFIHPIWIESKRNGFSDEDYVERFRKRAEERLKKVGSKLAKEFSDLNCEHSSGCDPNQSRDQ